MNFSQLICVSLYTHLYNFVCISVSLGALCDYLQHSQNFFSFFFSLGDYTAAVFQHWRDIERTRVNEVGDGADGPAAAEAQSQMNCSRNNPITAAP